MTMKRNTFILLVMFVDEIILSKYSSNLEVFSWKINYNVLAESVTRCRCSVVCLALCRRAAYDAMENLNSQKCYGSVQL